MPDTTKPQTLNRYSYVLNNPLRFNDQTGHVPGDYWDVFYGDPTMPPGPQPGYITIPEPTPPPEPAASPDPGVSSSNSFWQNTWNVFTLIPSGIQAGMDAYEAWLESTPVGQATAPIGDAIDDFVVSYGWALNYGMALPGPPPISGAQPLWTLII